MNWALGLERFRNSAPPPRGSPTQPQTNGALFKAYDTTPEEAALWSNMPMQRRQNSIPGPLSDLAGNVARRRGRKPNLDAKQSLRSIQLGGF